VSATREVKPEYYNVKMVYSPVVTEARQITPAGGKVVVPMLNRYSFTDLGELACKWQAFAGGRELAHGDAQVACPPRSSAQATFPATAGMDTLRLEFFHPDGRSVYSANLRTPDYQHPQAPAALKGQNAPQLTQTDDEITITGASTLTFDKKIRADQVLDRRQGNPGHRRPHPQPRRGTRARQGVRGRVTALQSPKPPELRNVVMSAQMNGATAHVAATADVYLSNSPELLGQLSYSFDIAADAQADFSWKLAWKAADATAYEAGIKFLLPAGINRLAWSSENQWTDYPPDHIGNTFGTTTSKEISFRSSKRDIHWVALSGAGNDSLVALSTGDPKQPIHARGLATADGTLLFLTSAIAIPADFSSNLFPGYDIRLTPATPLGSAFRLRLAAKP